MKHACHHLHLLGHQITPVPSQSSGSMHLDSQLRQMQSAKCKACEECDRERGEMRRIGAGKGGKSRCLNGISVPTKSTSVRQYRPYNPIIQGLRSNKLVHSPLGALEGSCGPAAAFAASSLRLLRSCTPACQCLF